MNGNKLISTYNQCLRIKRQHGLYLLQLNLIIIGGGENNEAAPLVKKPMLLLLGESNVWCSLGPIRAVIEKWVIHWTEQLFESLDLNLTNY